MDTLKFSVLFELEVHSLISSMVVFFHYLKLLLFMLNAGFVWDYGESSLL